MCAIKDQKKITKNTEISPAVILKILKMLINLFIPHSQSFRQGNSLILVEIRRCFPPGRRCMVRQCEHHWRRHRDKQDGFDLFDEFKFRRPAGLHKTVDKSVAMKDVPRFRRRTDTLCCRQGGGRGKARFSEFCRSLKGCLVILKFSHPFGPFVRQNSAGFGP